MPWWGWLIATVVVALVLCWLVVSASAVGFIKDVRRELHQENRPRRPDDGGFGQRWN